MTVKLTKDFWEEKYESSSTGWDLGSVSTPIKEYVDQIENKNISILIPGAGNSYEAEYLYNQGFKNVWVIDLAKHPLENILKRVPAFPKQHLIQGDFFTLSRKFDLIIEQTFFCAIDPKLREEYVEKMHSILKPEGKIIGLLFNAPLNTEHPPFGGNIEEYKVLFSKSFEIKTMEVATNSIKSGEGREVFINFIKK